MPPMVMHLGIKQKNNRGRWQTDLGCPPRSVYHRPRLLQWILRKCPTLTYFIMTFCRSMMICANSGLVGTTVIQSLQHVAIKTKGPPGRQRPICIRMFSCKSAPNFRILFCAEYRMRKYGDFPRTHSHGLI